VHLASLRSVAALSGLAVVLTACSGGDAPQVATLATGTVDAAAVQAAPVDTQEAMLAFAACMRAEGLDFPDPTPDEEGNLRFGRPGGDGGFDPSQREVITAARDACAEHLEGLELGGPGGGRGQGEFDADLFLAYAECMRDNGIADFPDPGADGRPDREAMQALDRGSDEFQEATSTCADEVGFQAPGGGPGGPGAGQGGQR
jgi:hypothetical protein